MPQFAFRWGLATATNVSVGQLDITGFQVFSASAIAAATAAAAAAVAVSPPPPALRRALQQQVLAAPPPPSSGFLVNFTLAQGPGETAQATMEKFSSNLATALSAGKLTAALQEAGLRVDSVSVTRLSPIGAGLAARAPVRPSPPPLPQATLPAQSRPREVPSACGPLPPCRQPPHAFMPAACAVRRVLRV